MSEPEPREPNDEADPREEPGGQGPDGHQDGTEGPDGPGAREVSQALDDDAAFAEIVAAYNERPTAEPGAEPWPEAENVSTESAAAGDGTRERADGTGSDEVRSGRPPGSFIVYAPGVGPRDWSPADPDDEAEDDSDEGHFVPPEPPPLPASDVTSRFAWLAVVGGPLLLLAAVVFRMEMTWWLTTLGVGGFLGGFATLVLRMKDSDEDGNDDPGRGAVV